MRVSRAGIAFGVALVGALSPDRRAWSQDVDAAVSAGHADGSVEAQTDSTDGTEPQQEAQDEVVVVDERDPVVKARAIVWLEPATTIYFAIAGAMNVAVGANIPVAAGVDIVASVNAIAGTRRILQVNSVSPTEQNVYGFGGWIGMSYVFGSARTTGPFIAPRIGVMYRESHERDSAGAMSVTPEVELGFGLDLGYQLQDNWIFLVGFLGGNVSYCWNCPRVETVVDAMGMPVLDPSGEPVLIGRRTNGFVPGVNLSLIRVGVVF